MTKEKHEHDFRLKTIHVPLHKYIKDEGKGRMKKDLMSGKDILDVWVCECGLKEAVNLTRVTA